MVQRPLHTQTHKQHSSHRQPHNLINIVTYKLRLDTLLAVSRKKAEGCDEMHI